ncbi:Scr1 family TA system antitoxin-like transcriptional regulator [Streptomyces diastatochromogenes]|nr:Scr1 family TA system antitoxin-like transcriptional regulator [Streptomyces diastatochromogenes]MCZ0986901.1 Scr1 family TA system antitoxin-like transcriptional regulator [Streptomyces diastatochromogenes]
MVITSGSIRYVLGWLQERLRGLANAVGWDPSLFKKLESGETMGSPEVAEALDEYYGTPGLLLAMWEMAVGDPNHELDQQVETRLGRRQLLESADPPLFRVILSEAVLRTSLRDAGAWREQLEHLADGRTVAYTENDLRGELVEDNASVEELQRRYDAESHKFILRMLEEMPCEPST